MEILLSKWIVQESFEAQGDRYALCNNIMKGAGSAILIENPFEGWFVHYDGPSVKSHFDSGKRRLSKKGILMHSVESNDEFELTKARAQNEVRVEADYSKVEGFGAF